MLALQAACLYDVLGATFDELIDEFLRDTVNQHDLGIKRPLPPEVLSFARQLARAAWQGQGVYDKLLSAAVTGWSVQRMAPIDRNILRIGLHELLDCPETPHQVVINEAIELARRFGDVDSPGFVNGVLDGIRREQGLAEAPEGPNAPPPADAAGPSANQTPSTHE